MSFRSCQRILSSDLRLSYANFVAPTSTQFDNRMDALLAHEKRGILQHILVPLHIDVIFHAFVLAQTRSWTQHDRAVTRPWPGQHNGIFDRIFVNDRIQVDARKFLDYVQLFAVKCAYAG